MDKELILTKSRDFIGSNTVSINDEFAYKKRIKEFPYVNRITSKISNKSTRVYLNKYFLDTYDYLIHLREIVKRGGKIIIVIGDSNSENVSIPTSSLIWKMAKEAKLELIDIYKYPIRNKRMNYIRRNGANIKAEKILVFRRG